jgi:hypothetical protein
MYLVFSGKFLVAGKPVVVVFAHSGSIAKRVLKHLTAD